MSTHPRDIAEELDELNDGLEELALMAAADEQTVPDTLLRLLTNRYQELSKSLFAILEAERRKVHG